ncbi:MAG: lactonase family protein [Bacteroidales bacterium]|nr:lactonase family protein [Bacteroidales bacterium]
MKKYSVLVYSLLFFTGLFSTGCRENSIFFAGGFSNEGEKGFSVFKFDNRNGIAEKISDWDAGTKPAFFCYNSKRNLIYILNEVMEFRGTPGSGLTTLEYDPLNNLIKKRNEILVPYGGSCHISLSADKQFLFFANYATGSVAVVGLDENGIPERVTDSILYATEAQDVSHPHMILQDPSGKHIYLTDLGLDRIVKYDLDTSTGKLIQSENGIIELSEGSGPRHFVFNPDGSQLYVINELGSTLMVFNVVENGVLKLVQTLPTVKPGFEGKNFCADIHIGTNNKFLYGSNRGENSIVVFRIEGDGTLTLAGSVSCGGDWPRNFIIDPSGKFLLVGNQRSDNISVLRINRKTGIPGKPVSNTSLKAPGCIRFWE